MLLVVSDAVREEGPAGASAHIGPGRRRSGLAAKVTAGPDDGLARRLLAAKYQGWVDGASLSAWAREALPIAIDLSSADPA